MSDRFLRIKQLEKSYGDLKVLQGIDIDIPLGAKDVLIGPSGSGKSTLLRILMTLESPTAGDVEIDGQSVWTTERGGQRKPADEAHLRTLRPKFGMVFQQFNLFPHMTALRNITAAPELVQGKSRVDAQQQAHELLDRVGLADKADSYPAQLSGGQKQRVAIARALAMQPEVMLFDEVTSALDPELVGEVLGVLRDLAHETNITMLIVTHEMQFARDIADRVLFFDHGVILEEAPPEKMFSEPEHDRTREFLRTVLD